MKMDQQNKLYINTHIYIYIPKLLPKLIWLGKGFTRLILSYSVHKVIDSVRSCEWQACCRRHGTPPNAFLKPQLQGRILMILTHKRSPLQFGLPLGLSDSLGGHLPPATLKNPQSTVPISTCQLKESGLCQHILGTGPKESEHVEHNAHTPVTPGLPLKNQNSWYQSMMTTAHNQSMRVAKSAPLKNHTPLPL